MLNKLVLTFKVIMEFIAPLGFKHLIEDLKAIWK